jgi:xanthine dehydrogenase molybdenum-binding subunit
VEAAAALKAELDKGLTLADLAGRSFMGEIKIDDTTAPGTTRDGKIKTHTTFGWATQMAVLDEAGALARVVAAHDVGRAINPQQCEAQIQGAVHMGLGYALTEELPCRDGVPVTFDMRNIGVLRAQHVPPVEVILVEEPEPEGPFGAKGVGEIGLVPTAGAVAAALEAFDGKRRMTLPMKDSPAARAIDVGQIPRSPAPTARSPPGRCAPTPISTAGWRATACRQHRRRRRTSCRSSSGCGGRSTAPSMPTRSASRRPTTWCARSSPERPR